MKLNEAIEVLKKWQNLYDGTSELLEWNMEVFNEAIDTVVAELEKPLPTDVPLHECPICKQKAGKTYLAARLPTICQKCDHIWLRG